MVSRMKNILFFVMCILWMPACQKSSATPSANFVYKVNGIQISVAGDCDSTNQNLATGSYFGCYAIGDSSSTYYMVFGSRRSDILNFGIDTRALTIPLNSAFGLGMRLDVNGIKYGLYGNWSQDSMFVKITRYSNGSFDGTFSGSVSDSTQTKRAVITNGKFTNVKVIYAH
jgi:hypothetical protein